MSYVYTVFGSTYAGGVVLPTTLHPFSETPGPITSPIVELPGRGAWDSLGSGIAKPETQQITHRGKVIAASAAALQTSRDALRALKGKRDILWKTNDGGTTKRWRYARVMDVRIDNGLGSFCDIVEMDFELLPGLWNGTAHTAEVHALTTAAPTGTFIALVNNGNVRVRDMRLVVTHVVTNPITLFRVDGPLSSWQYNGSIAVGGYLDVYCGSKRVWNVADDFAHFSLLTAHYDSDWLPLEPGTNTIKFSRTGGDNSATIEVTFYDGWA
jgi:hypothetical protein